MDDVARVFRATDVDDQWCHANAQRNLGPVRILSPHGDTGGPLTQPPRSVRPPESPGRTPPAHRPPPAPVGIYAGPHFGEEKRGAGHGVRIKRNNL